MGLTEPKCEDCGLLYQDFPMDVTIPNDQWVVLTGYTDGEGILCGSCIIQRGVGKYIVARLSFEWRIQAQAITPPRYDAVFDEAMSILDDEENL